MWNSKIREEKAIAVAEHLAEGCSIKGTARLVRVDDGTLSEATTQFLERVNQHCFPVHTELMQDDAEECAGLLYSAPLQPDGLYLWDDWQIYQ